MPAQWSARCTCTSGPCKSSPVHGEQLTEPTWQDVVNVPARSDITLRIAFDHFTGRTVYHCHILDQEDRGITAIIEAR